MDTTHNAIIRNEAAPIRLRILGSLFLANGYIDDKLINQGSYNRTTISVVCSTTKWDCNEQETQICDLHKEDSLLAKKTKIAVNKSFSECYGIDNLSKLYCCKNLVPVTG